MSEVVASPGVIVPSSPADRQKLKNQLTEIVYAMSRMQGERDAIKSILVEIEESFEIPKKVANKLAKTMYKRDYGKQQAEQEDFECLYETIVEGVKTATEE